MKIQSCRVPAGDLPLIGGSTSMFGIHRVSPSLSSVSSILRLPRPDLQMHCEAATRTAGEDPRTKSRPFTHLLRVVPVTVVEYRRGSVPLPRGLVMKLCGPQRPGFAPSQ